MYNYKNKEDLHSQIFYLKILATQLDRWKERGGYVYQFRCPYCGDSQKSKYKARGYFYQNDNGLLSYNCQNCGIPKSFKMFLKEQNPAVYSQYILANINQSSTSTIAPLAKKEEKVNKHLENAACVPVSDLSRLHIAVEYLKDRKIPESLFNRFYYTENFKEFCESIENYTDVPDDPRIILVEEDIHQNLKFVVARAIKDSKKKYIVLRMDEDYPKLFGYSRMSNRRTLYVVEGPIDSLFIDNAIATIDANLDCKELEKDYDIVYVHDNEPRSKIIVNKIDRFIKSGKSVVIFDKKNHHKDINDMVKNGYDINQYLRDRTFKGIKATLEFNSWKKLDSGVALRKNRKDR